MKRRSWIALVLGGVSVACAAGAFERRRLPRFSVDKTQGPGSSTAIEGVMLRRDTKAPLKGGVIILHGDRLEAPREALTTADGRYRFDDLPPGTYTLQALYAGFDERFLVTVEPGQRARVWLAVDHESRPSIVT